MRQQIIEDDPDRDASRKSSETRIRGAEGQSYSHTERYKANDSEWRDGQI